MEENSLKATLREKLTDYLNAHKQRKTPERYAILETIYSIEGHFDIDQLYDVMLNEEKFRVSRATLYNTLNLFFDAHLVQRHQFGESSQYERLLGCEHHHALCTMCGTVTEFSCPELKELTGKIKLKRFSPQHSSLYMLGLCSKCAARQTRMLKKINNKE